MAVDRAINLRGMMTVLIMSMSAQDMYSKFGKIPFTPLLAVVAIALSIFITSNLATRKQNIITKGAAAAVDVSFGSNQLTIAPNTTAVYDVYISTKNSYKASAVSLDVSLSSPLVTITDLQILGVMPVVFESSFTNTTARIVVGVNPTSPFMGTGQIARLTLAAGNTTGQTTLSFASSSEVSVVGETGNSLASAQSSTITVGSSTVTSTVTPTPRTGRNTPTPTLSQSTPTPTTSPVACSGICVRSTATCGAIDPSAQCGFGRVCCIDGN